MPSTNSNSPSKKKNKENNPTPKEPKAKKKSFFFPDFFSLLIPSKFSLLTTLLALLTIIGILDTSTLLYNTVYNGGECISLNFLGGSCDEVTQSVYGKIYEIPISLFGLIAYTFLLLCSLLAFKHRAILFYIVILTAIGTSLSAYLVHLQWNVLKVWCPLCLISAANFLLLFFISFGLFISSLKKNSPKTSLWQTKWFFPKFSINKLLFRFFIFTSFIALLGFEIVRSRTLIKKQSKFPATEIGCGFLASSELAASINNRIIPLAEIDKTIPFSSTEACALVTTLRLTALDYMLLEMDAKNKNQSIGMILESLGMENNLTKLVNSPLSLKIALQLNNIQSNEKIIKDIARIHIENDVKINLDSFASPNLETLQLSQLAKNQKTNNLTNTTTGKNIGEAASEETPTETKEKKD